MHRQRQQDGSCTVTFELPAGVGATRAHVGGEFNDWSSSATPMKRRKNETLAATVTLEQGRHRFRYLLDDGTWENGWAGDDYSPNEFGGDDCRQGVTGSEIVR